MISPIPIESHAADPGEHCALCKQAFVLGDEIISCPVDGARHHHACWQANNNHCSALGCSGQGDVGNPPLVAALEGEIIRGPGRTKVRTLPSTDWGCRRGCCFLIALVMTLTVGAACIGFWSLTESFLALFS